MIRPSGNGTFDDDERSSCSVVNAWWGDNGVYSDVHMSRPSDRDALQPTRQVAPEVAAGEALAREVGPGRELVLPPQALAQPVVVDWEQM